MTTPKRKSVKPKTVKRWAIYNECGILAFTKVFPTKRSAIEYAEEFMEGVLAPEDLWSYYTCQPVHITPVKAKGGK